MLLTLNTSKEGLELLIYLKFFLRVGYLYTKVQGDNLEGLYLR